LIVVFDASTIVGAALKPDSIPRRALLAARKSATIALSEAVYDEIREVLGRAKFRAALSPRRQADILAMLDEDAIWVEPVTTITDCIDPKDDKYLELALAAGASVIVSSDKHLLNMHPWRGVAIRRPAGYLTVS
jgi:putative PIN family toxin of toxin-antitoxin system